MRLIMFLWVTCLCVAASAGRYVERNKSPRELIFITVAEYSRLSNSQRQKYIQDVREAFAKFEKATQGKVVARNLNGIMPYFLLEAHASKVAGKCMLGGRIHSIVGGNCSLGGRGGCATVDNMDSFKCGKIFGEVCATYNPGDRDSITKACLDAAANVTVTAEQYKEFVKNAYSDFRAICVEENMNAAQASDKSCDALQDQIDKISSVHDSSKKLLAEAVATPAPVVKGKASLKSDQDLHDVRPHKYNPNSELVYHCKNQDFHNLARRIYAARNEIWKSKYCRASSVRQQIWAMDDIYSVETLPNGECKWKSMTFDVYLSDAKTDKEFAAKKSSAEIKTVRLDISDPQWMEKSAAPGDHLWDAFKKAGLCPTKSAKDSANTEAK